MCVITLGKRCGVMSGCDDVHVFYVYISQRECLQKCRVHGNVLHVEYMFKDSG